MSNYIPAVRYVMIPAARYVMISKYFVKHEVLQTKLS